MTESDLRRLSRRDLLEMLLEITKENEQLQEINKQMQDTIESRKIELLDAGSIAEASLRLNGVFQAAQDAADQYLYNTQQLCKKMEEDARKKCEQMLSDTEKQVKQYEEDKFE